MQWLHLHLSQYCLGLLRFVLCNYCPKTCSWMSKLRYVPSRPKTGSPDRQARKRVSECGAVNFHAGEPKREVFHTGDALKFPAPGICSFRRGPASMVQSHAPKPTQTWGMDLENISTPMETPLLARMTQSKDQGPLSWCPSSVKGLGYRTFYRKTVDLGCLGAVSCRFSCNQIL